MQRHTLTITHYAFSSVEEIVKDWPETNEYTGKDCEVWIGTEKNLSSLVTIVCPLNKRIDDDGKVSADIIFETNTFDT